MRAAAGRLRVRGHEPVREPEPSSARARTSSATRATSDRDAELAAAAGVDLLFAPPPEEVYPDGFSTTVEVAGLTDVLCGAPGSRGAAHFTGVATVVDEAAQHVRAGRGLLRPEGLPAVARDPAARARPRTSRCAIEVCPTVREPDGLALSSRNAYLDDRAARARREPEPRARRGGAGGRSTAPPARRSAAPRSASSGAAGVEPGVRRGAARRRPRRPRVAPGERVVRRDRRPGGPRAADRQHPDRASQCQRATRRDAALVGG